MASAVNPSQAETSASIVPPWVTMSAVESEAGKDATNEAARD